MSRPKPKIYKHDGSWWVELPAFGFSMVDVRYPFDTWTQAGDWLVDAKKDAHTSGSFDRGAAPQSRHAALGWPMVIR